MSDEKAPPQLSADGNWWWDGDRWVPVEHTGSDAYCHNCRQWVNPSVQQPPELAGAGCLGCLGFFWLVMGVGSLTGLFWGQLGNVKWGTLIGGVVAGLLSVALYRKATREPAKVTCPICRGDRLSRPAQAAEA